jgi:hypothetical protein
MDEVGNGCGVVRWWVRVIVVLGAALLLMGAAVALFQPGMLVAPHEVVNGAVRVYAGYLASRNLGLAIALLAAMMLGRNEALKGLMLLTAAVQGLDVVMDCVEGRWAVVPGVAVLGILFLIGASRVRWNSFRQIET